MMTAERVRTVLVTGASAGIGLRICESLLDEGCIVLALARRRCPLAHPRLIPVEVDLADPAATRDVAQRICAEHAVTEVVHNAGTIRPAPLAEVKLSDLQTLVDLHLSAALLLVQAALPEMRAAHHGRIVLLATRGMLGLAERTAYAATKAGLLGLARTWAVELARDGITANVVAPGPVHSEMFDQVLPPGSGKAEALAHRIPVGRIGEPEDVARAVRFFLAPDAGFVTGQTLYVCGGTSLGGLTL